MRPEDQGCRHAALLQLLSQNRQGFRPPLQLVREGGGDRVVVFVFVCVLCVLLLELDVVRTQVV